MGADPSPSSSFDDDAVAWLVGLGDVEVFLAGLGLLLAVGRRGPSVLGFGALLVAVEGEPPTLDFGLLSDRSRAVREDEARGMLVAWVAWKASRAAASGA